MVSYEAVAVLKNVYNWSIDIVLQHTRQIVDETSIECTHIMAIKCVISCKLYANYADYAQIMQVSLYYALDAELCDSLRIMRKKMRAHNREIPRGVPVGGIQCKNWP